MVKLFKDNPTIDKPQTRDTQYLVSDGQNWFHAEKQHTKNEIERLDCHSLGDRYLDYRDRKSLEVWKLKSSYSLEVVGGA